MSLNLENLKMKLPVYQIMYLMEEEHASVSIYKCLSLLNVKISYFELLE